MQRMTTRLLLTTLFLFGFSCLGFAQDAGQVLRLSVGFRTMKNTVQMSDEKRKAVETLELQARTASNEQKFSDAYKYYSHAIALMRNQSWTPSQALAAGLQVKAERVILDPGDTVKLSLTQFFVLDEPIAGKLGGSLEIKNNKQGVAKELKRLENIEPNFASPLTVESVTPDLADGEYQLVLTLKPKEGDSIVKPVAIRIARGLTADSSALKKRAISISAKLNEKKQESLLAAIPAVEYAASMIDLINAGQISANVDVKAALASANASLDQIAKGENPLKTKRGDIHWAYRSKVDDTLQPYRFFIPSSYDSSKQWPLVVALHGMGGDENSFFNGYDEGAIKRLAESRGYLVVCPKGRQPASMYLAAAEKDVIDVIAEMKREFSIDETRIYLTGHSMGGYGTWSIAVNHPDLFAALAPFAGGGMPQVIVKLRTIAHIPWIVVHGDADPTVPVGESRRMVKAGQDLGIEIKYIEVPGGNHGNIVVPAFKDVFDWFDAHKRQPKGAAKAAGSGQR